MNVYLIGYMGSGKTTVGKKLAARLGLKFVDMDEQLETAANTTITNWFEDKGEEDFRDVEESLLKDVSKQEGLVVATGGGTPCFKNNLGIMGKSGVVVYLEMPLPILVSRVSKEADKRPLLKGKSEKEMLDFITTHFEERKTFYEQAHLKVNAVNLDASKIDDVAELIGALF